MLGAPRSLSMENASIVYLNFLNVKITLHQERQSQLRNSVSGTS